jgi:ATP-dependent Lon protease
MILDLIFRKGDSNMVEESNRDTIFKKLLTYFPGKIVRKDLTKKIKEGANVPVYVLEYLLGMYCSSQDEEIIEQGVQNVKDILARNYVRPDEAQKIISKLRETGSYTVIDKISVKLNYKTDTYEAEFSNLGLRGVTISHTYPSEYERLLSGGIWCIVQMEYYYDEEDKKGNPFVIRKLTPIQMPGINMDELKEVRKYFSDEEWIDVVLRSIGMEPDNFDTREKWLHLARLIPLVENNYNFCELGPRGTGKSHVYKEISPNSILVSGGQTTVANLFYNMASKQVGLVGMWDCVAFDEVAGISFKDNDGVQIMKDYMASGSFSRGKEEKNASASFAFVGNINQSVDVLLKTSNLFEPFPEAMGMDTAFLDRMHCYLPGWEIPKYRPEYFTDDYGFITDYFSEIMRELRKISYADSYDKYFKLGNQLNQRDTIAVKKTISGMVKLIYPDGNYTKENIEKILRFAMEMRRRVKEQLKKIGGMEFYDVNFSYIDLESFNEEYVPVPEQGGGSLIPEGIGKPGHVYHVSRGKSGMIGVYKLETQMTAGNGKFERTGLGSNSAAKETVDTAYKYLKANSKNISGNISTTTRDYLINVQDLNGIGMTTELTLSSVIAICSVALGKPPISSMTVLGDISIGGTLIKVDELANTLQVCLDSGAKKVLLPLTSAADLGTAPPELIGAFNLIFYNSPEDAVFKALGAE